MKEFITHRQGAYIVTLFVFAGNIMSGSISGLKQDAWISTLLSLVIVIPVVLMYGRIMNMFPQMDLSEILHQLFGRIFGKVMFVPFIIYVFLVSTLAICMLTYFADVVFLQDTPHIIIAGSIIAVTGYMSFAGVRCFGNWASIKVPLVVALFLVTVILSYDRYNIDHLLPVGVHSFSDLLDGSTNLFTFPFAEIVIFTSMGSHIRGRRVSYRVLLGGLLFSFFLLLAIQFRNILVLGPHIYKTNYYSSYTAARYIKVGTFLNRIEGTISINYLMAGIAKISLCQIVLSRSISKLVGIKDSKSITVPICLVLSAFSIYNFKSIMELYEFMKVYKYLAVPFQLLFPFIVWIVAELRMAAARKKAAETAA